MVQNLYEMTREGEKPLFISKRVDVLNRLQNEVRSLEKWKYNGVKLDSVFCGDRGVERARGKRGATRY